MMFDVLPTIVPLDTEPTDLSRYTRVTTGIIIKTHNNKILLQQRGASAPTYAGGIGNFGGGLDDGEAAIACAARELQEELGVTVALTALVSLGVVEYTDQGGLRLIYGYFWHDTAGAIVDCYEGFACYFDHAAGAYANPTTLPEVTWWLRECVRRGLIVA